jgi:hypothetical protein
MATLDDVNSNLLSLVNNVGQVLKAIQQTFPGQFVAVPATSSSAGIPGQFSYNASFLYLCVASNSWRRIALSTF